MGKRGRTKATTAAKTKHNDKDKASNSEETFSKDANICVDGSPLATKKPKLNSSRSPKKSQKYVPPFTASQRVSTRLMNIRINSEKSQDKLGNKQGKLIKDFGGEGNGPKNELGKENLPGKSEKESSSMVFQSTEDNMSPIDTNLIDVEMKAEKVEEKDFKRAENTCENTSETSPASVESSTNTCKGENMAFSHDINEQPILREVPKVSDLAQQSYNHVETNGKSKEETRMIDTILGESLKESIGSNLETSAVVDEQFICLESIKLEINDVGIGISEMSGLQTLAETCAGKEYIDVASVEEELNKSERSSRDISSGSLQQHSIESETKLSNKNEEDDNNDSNNLDVADEKTPLSFESEDMQVQINEIKNSSGTLPSQEVIENLLSEMLSIIIEEEFKGLPLSQNLKFESNANTSPITNNADECLDKPVNASNTVTEIMPIEDESDKCKSDGSQSKCIEESVSMNLQNTSKPENIKTEQCEVVLGHNECYPTIIEKVDDAESERVFASVNIDKNSQKASRTKTLETDLSSQKTNEPTGNFISKRIMDEQLGSRKGVLKNDQEVPNKVATSPEQEVPEKMDTFPPVIVKKSTETFDHEEVASSVSTSSENTTAHMSQDESKKVKRTVEDVEMTTSNNIIEEMSFTEEFKALEELLPADYMGLDDVLLSKPESISVNNELPSGDGTIEFLINELNSLHRMVASYERALEDRRRQYKSNGRF